MNFEHIVQEAAEVIDTWESTRTGSCQLYINKGHVTSKITRPPKASNLRRLIIDHQHQKHGLTWHEWEIIGNLLLKQYIKELACQAHQKP